MEQFLVDLNKSQLDKGLDANGSHLGYYRPATYAYAEDNGRPKTSPEINLLDTGSFRAAFTAIIFGNQMYFSSGDRKANILEQIYGDSILGLPIDKKEIIGNKLIEILTIKVTNLLTNA